MKWIEYDPSDTPPAFNDYDIVEVEYRDGRGATDDEPWMFAGWLHNGGRGDIMRFKVVDRKY